MSPEANPTAERVLVLAPIGRDAEMLCERIAAEGMDCEICTSLPVLLEGISSGAGAVVIAQEALTPRGIEELLSTLDAQEPWSDLPIILLSETASKKRPQAARLVSRSGLFERANVTLLQRPIGIRFFVSVVRAAVRARRRQYQMRDLHRELQQAIDLSDMFVSILGHDLRSPLTAIKMAGELIVRSSPDARALRPAGRILSAADRMTRMIEQILDFARARRKLGIPIQTKPMQLGEFCRHTVEELADANPDADIHFTETGNLCGIWDADRLAQVMSNLIGNAVQHGAPGKPIQVEVDGTDAGIVRLRVHNVGFIPPDTRARLFRPFEQASPGARRLGLGLGLFIAREIARAHGGDIEVRSAEDRTTFEVTLPREAPPIETVTRERA